MKKLSWRQSKIKFLKTHYEKYLEEFAGPTDDRIIYCNTYRQIMSAVESLPEDPEIYIKCAMNHSINKDLQMMDSIILRFHYEAREEAK